MYIRIYHLNNRNGVQQTSIDPTIDDFYYDGSAIYRTIPLSGVNGMAQITFHLWIMCETGFCGSRCAEQCTSTTASGDTHLSNLNCTKNVDFDIQQRMSKLSTESTITIVTGTVLTVLVLIGLIMLLALIVIKWKGM